MTIETLNDHLVGVQGDLITMMIPATGPMTRDKALRLRGCSCARTRAGSVSPRSATPAPTPDAVE